MCQEEKVKYHVVNLQNNIREEEEHTRTINAIPTPSGEIELHPFRPSLFRCRMGNIVPVLFQIASLFCTDTLLQSCTFVS